MHRGIAPPQACIPESLTNHPHIYSLMKQMNIQLTPIHIRYLNPASYVRLAYRVRFLDMMVVLQVCTT